MTVTNLTRKDGKATKNQEHEFQEKSDLWPYNVGTATRLRTVMEIIINSNQTGAPATCEVLHICYL